MKSIALLSLLFFTSFLLAQTDSTQLLNPSVEGKSQPGESSSVMASMEKDTANYPDADTLQIVAPTSSEELLAVLLESGPGVTFEEGQDNLYRKY